MFTFLNLMPDLTAHKDKGVAFSEDDYVEKIAYKGLVASHIKPCHICLEELNHSTFCYNG